MPTLNLDKETRQLITDARTLGGKGISVRLDDNELLRLYAVVAVDLGQQQLVKSIASETDLEKGYYRTPLEWFKAPVPSDVRLDATFKTLKSQIDDFTTYFKGLCALHKRRTKFARILEYQPIATMQQVVPRSLLEFGTRPSQTLASWLVWRKWLYDIDNRSAQETGYLFEPILASALGGIPIGAQGFSIPRPSPLSNPGMAEALASEEAGIE